MGHAGGRERQFRIIIAYSPQDIGRVEEAAAAAGAEALICTEKDVFNLRGSMPGAMPVYACRIRLEVFDPEGFWAAVLKAVQKRKPAVPE